MCVWKFNSLKNSRKKRQTKLLIDVKPNERPQHEICVRNNVEKSSYNDMWESNILLFGAKLEQKRKLCPFLMWINKHLRRNKLEWMAANYFWHHHRRHVDTNILKQTHSDIAFSIKRMINENSTVQNRNLALFIAAQQIQFEGWYTNH